MEPKDYPIYFDSTHDAFQNAKILRKNMTKVEKLIWSRLRKKQVLGFKFRRQHPIDSYITDFYCHEKRLVIEIDGDIHKQQEQKVYDQHRNKELENLGLKILRIPNEDVENNIDSVIDKIKDALLND